MKNTGRGRKDAANRPYRRAAAAAVCLLAPAAVCLPASGTVSADCSGYEASKRPAAEGLQTGVLSWLRPFSCAETPAEDAADLSWMSADALLYGRPGSDYGKGHVYTFASACSPLAVQSPLPSRFSWADLGKKPKVRSQGTLATCWAITAAEAVESDLLPDCDTEFSADHISLQNGFRIAQNEGGDYSMIMAYMASVKGPVPEEGDPDGDGVSPYGLRPSVRVSEMRLLTGMSKNRIRHMIYRFGAVQSSLAMDRERTDGTEFHYYDATTYAYYDPMPEKLNHDILILGWDDDYPKENFRIRPRQNGAWICQNSWGEDFGDSGVFYVSYEDANLFRKGGIAYTDVESADEYSDVLEQDSLGWQARQGYGTECAYAAGVFRAAGEQQLSAVGFYATGPATAYQIFLIPDYTDESSLSGGVSGDSAAADPVQAADGEESSGAAGGRGAAVSLGAGWLENPGWYTISADRPQRIAEGQRFAVVIRIDTPGAGRPVAVETRKDRYTENVTLKGRETYISRDGRKWERTQTSYGTNICMKVFLTDR